MHLPNYGFLRVAVAVPRVSVGNPEENARTFSRLLEEAEAEGVSLLVFPELSLTGYTIGDLFLQETLLKRTLTGLEILLETTRFRYRGICVVGFPFLSQGLLYNCAGVLHQGRILGIVPKIYIPNYKEFYERRWFTPGGYAPPVSLEIEKKETRFGNHLIFVAQDYPGFALGVEICEDLWVPNPPSSSLALLGATVIANLSASDEYVGKAGYRRSLVLQQSARTLSAYLYTSCGPGESTTDLVYSGHALIAENGTLLVESERFSQKPRLYIADLDLERLLADRRMITTWSDARNFLGGVPFEVVPFAFGELPTLSTLKRPISAFPFVPGDPQELDERCREILSIQRTALAHRLETVQPHTITIGVSGGLDSTLALLVTILACEDLMWVKERILAFVLTGFGTGDRTLSNARSLMKHLDLPFREMDIRPLCFELMKAMGHRPFGIPLDSLGVQEFIERLKEIPPEKREDLLFENLQARLRTQILMNAGFMVGTGDLSELALGFCTYGGDHMSMYNPNAGVPKTLVRFLIRWMKEKIYRDTPLAQTLDAILETPITPELLPLAGEVQQTERIIGPYELHDFFLYYLLRFGYSPRKIFFLARQARFSKSYSSEELLHWLKLFLTRFFAHQYKRSVLPDGPKVGSVSLSPRGDFRMPSDLSADLWLKELEELSC